jgi:hypothetical protein
MDLPTVRKLLAIGAGIGIEVGEEDLTVAAVRVRPSGARLLGSATIAGFRDRPAVDWGATYADFVKRAGASHLSATVLLRRSDVIVRLLAMPGVAGRDLAAAVELQIDSLHPFPEGQAVWSWARLGGGAVLVVIAHREVLDRHISLFAEAGIKVAAFTFSGVALYSALRLLGQPPKSGFVAFAHTGNMIEAYGESDAKPMFSAAFDVPLERAAALAAAELRLDSGSEPLDAASLLPKLKGVPSGFDLSRSALAYAAALTGACPRLALPVNLLPAEYRTSNSRAALIPVAALAAVVLMLLAALASITPIEDRKYMRALESEIAGIEPLARKAGTLDREIDAARARSRTLDEFRSRSKVDLDAVLDLTHLLAPPTALESLDLTRDSVLLVGGAEQAAQLLKVIDSSPLFRGSEFSGGLTHTGKFDGFRIRAARKGVPQ